MRFGIGRKLGLLASALIVTTVLIFSLIISWWMQSQAIVIEEHAGQLLLVKVLLIAGGVAVAFLLSRYITRPLEAITEATRELARGNFDVVLPVRANDEIGELARCFKDMVDQLRQRGQELRENEARLRAVLKTAAEGILIADEQGQIQMVNHAAERIFGYGGDELRGQAVKLLIPKEVQGLSEVGFSPGESLKIGKVSNSTQEVTGRRKDG